MKDHVNDRFQHVHQNIKKKIITKGCLRPIFKLVLYKFSVAG